MRYRAYRRKRKKIRDKQLAILSEFSGYPSPALRVNVLDNGKHDHIFDEKNGYTYVKRTYRGKISHFLKKHYARRLRRGKNKLIAYRGCDYKRASGDFWWDIS